MDAPVFREQSIIVLGYAGDCEMIWLCGKAVMVPRTYLSGLTCIWDGYGYSNQTR